MSHTIRLATASDSEEILAIYAPYVKDTAISFETELPEIGEFTRRIERIAAKYPYLVCQIDGRIVGYAYASRHMERAAYRFNVETSIYVSQGHHGRGVAGKLYGCLLELAGRLGYCNAYAGITVPNEKSMRFHQKFGFSVVGTYHETGYKFETWHAVALLEKSIRQHTVPPPDIKMIGDLPGELLETVFASYTD